MFFFHNSNRNQEHVVDDKIKIKMAIENKMAGRNSTHFCIKLKNLTFFFGITMF